MASHIGDGGGSGTCVCRVRRPAPASRSAGSFVSLNGVRLDSDELVTAGLLGDDSVSALHDRFCGRGRSATSCSTACSRPACWTASTPSSRPREAARRNATTPATSAGRARGPRRFPARRRSSISTSSIPSGSSISSAASRGIDGLITDPMLCGGGLHKIPAGGRFAVHADFNRHPVTQARQPAGLHHLPEQGLEEAVWRRAAAVGCRPQPLRRRDPAAVRPLGPALALLAQPARPSRSGPRPGRPHAPVARPPISTATATPTSAITGRWRRRPHARAGAGREILETPGPARRLPHAHPPAVVVGPGITIRCYRPDMSSRAQRGIFPVAAAQRSLAALGMTGVSDFSTMVGTSAFSRDHRLPAGS